MDADNGIPTDINSETILSGSNRGLNLKQMRDNAQKNLEGLLNALGFHNRDPQDALRELNERIQEFHATTANFNGPLLRAKIINPLKGIVVNEMEIELNNFKNFVQSKQTEIGQAFIEVVQQLSQEIANNNYGGDTGQILSQEVAEELYASLNQMTFDLGKGTVTLPGSGKKSGITGGGQLVSKEAKAVLKKLTAGINRVNFSNDVDPSIKQLIVKDTNFSRRLLLLAQSMGIQTGNIYATKVKAPDFKMEETDNGITIYFDILKPFLDVMDPSDAKGTKGEKAAQAYFEGLPPDKKQIEIEKLCARATEFLGQFFNADNLPSGRAAILRERFNQAIRDIIVQYPGALFVGRNEQGVIGILGEIQGLYYMYSILGDLRADIAPEQLVQWIGGDTSAGGGVKTGADLVIKLGEKLGYGIQIKNSMDVAGATSFSDFSLSNQHDSAFFNQLVTFGISKEIVEQLENVFIMQGFNIGYYKKGEVYVKGTPKDGDVVGYFSTYGKLLEIIERANRYMALAAAMIMRIQYLEGQNFEQSNTLWIVGGTAIISAAQILDDLIKQIDGVMDGNMFRARATTKLGDTGYTIVDYLNKRQANFNDLKTALSTSYNFHKTS